MAKEIEYFSVSDLVDVKADVFVGGGTTYRQENVVLTESPMGSGRYINLDAITGITAGDTYRIKIDNQFGGGGIYKELLSLTGITYGDSWTLAKFCKVMAAMLVGKWQDKTGIAGTYQILDPDDGITVIMEIVPSTATPQKTVSVLI